MTFARLTIKPLCAAAALTMILTAILSSHASAFEVGSDPLFTQADAIRVFRDAQQDVQVHVRKLSGTAAWYELTSSSTPVEAFVMFSSHEFQTAYATGAAHELSRIASRTGATRAARCYAELTKSPVPSLISGLNSGRLNPRTGVIPSLRRLCVSDAMIEAQNLGTR